MAGKKGMKRGIRKTDRSASLKRSTRRPRTEGQAMRLKEGLPPQPTSPEDRAQAMEHGNQRALLAESTAQSQGVPSDGSFGPRGNMSRPYGVSVMELMGGPPRLSRELEEDSRIYPANMQEIEDRVIRRLTSDTKPQQLGTGQVGAAPQPPARQTYNALDEAIEMQFETLEKDHSFLIGMINSASAADPHAPDHVDLMRALKNAAQHYILSSRRLMDLTDFTVNLQPQPQGGSNR